MQQSIVADGVEEKLYTISYEINSCVFDEKGSYGAMQRRPKDIPVESAEGKRLRDMIARYHPNYNETQMDAFLKKLSSEGCGYVAVLNAVFAHFEGKEDEFEQKIGFPMYGTTSEDKNYRAQLYLKKKGIKVRVTKCGAMSPGKFKELSQSGYVLMSLRDGNIRYEDGKKTEISYEYVEYR